MRGRYLVFLTAMLVAIMAASSCNNSNEKGNDDEASKADRHIYSPEVNKVEITTLKRTEFKRQVISNGKLTAHHRTALSFHASGTVADVAVRNGQRVRAGQIIARLDATDRQLVLNSSRIAFEKAQVDLQDVLVGLGYPAGDTTVVPQDILALAKIRSGWNSSENSLKIASRAFNETTLKSPVQGRIADLAVKIHDQVGSGPICIVLDDSSYEIDFPVLETELPLLRSASEVKVLPYSMPDATPGTGRIEYINPTVGKGGQITVRARISSNPAYLDGMNAKVVIEQSVPDRLVVPKSAVVIRDNLDVLFRYSCGRAQWVYVKILESNGDSHSVIANTDRGATLHEGDTVIVSGNLNLADGTLVELKR